jgi:hypothetical protein
MHFEDTRKIQDLYGSSPNTLSQSLFNSRAPRSLKPAKYYFRKYTGILGIEVEVEHFLMSYEELTKDRSFWNRIGDDSLKDHGAEWISIPVQGKNIDYALTELNDIFTIAKSNEYYFNHRCSIHVHLNVSQMGIGKLRQLYITYALLEPYFFAWCDPNRKNNPFCVPLYIQQETFEKLFTTSIESEQKGLKYLALANNHLSDYGTIEFRHLHGTDDMVLIRRWLMMIQKLFKFATESTKVVDPFDETQEQLAMRVFNTLFPLIPRPDESTMDHSKNAAYLLTL